MSSTQALYNEICCKVIEGTMGRNSTIMVIIPLSDTQKVWLRWHLPATLGICFFNFRVKITPYYNYI